MLTDHLCSTAFEALTAAAARGEQLESGAVPVQATVTAHKLVTARKLPGRAWKGKWPGRWRRGSKQQHQRQGSLTQVLIDVD